MNPGHDNPSLQKCLKTSSDCRKCHNELTKYFKKYSVKLDKKLGQEYLKDLAYLVGNSIETPNDDIILPISPEEVGSFARKATKETRSASSVYPSRNRDLTNSKIMKNEGCVYFSDDSASDIDIHIPSSKTMPSKTTTNALDGDSESSESSGGTMSFVSVRNLLKRVPRSPCNKTFVAIKDLKEIVFTSCSNKCNCIEKPLSRSIKGCTKADQLEFLKTYHHVPLGFRIVKFIELVTNLEVIYQRVVDQHGQGAGEASRSLSSPPPSPDLVQMGDLIACFPFVKSTIDDIIGKIKVIGLKLTSEAFGVNIVKLSVSQARYRMNEKAKAGVLQPQGINNCSCITLRLFRPTFTKDI